MYWFHTEIVFLKKTDNTNSFGKLVIPPDLSVNDFPYLFDKLMEKLTKKKKLQEEKLENKRKIIRVAKIATRISRKSPSKMLESKFYRNDR